MPYDLEFTLRVSVNSQEEMDKITEAVYSGLAAELVRFGVLYGQVPLLGVPADMAGVGNMIAAPATGGTIAQSKKKGPPVELKRVEDKVGSVAVSTEEKKPEKPKGILGAGRMRRT